MIISFAGHSVVSMEAKTKEMVKEQIRNNISKAEKTLFISADTEILTKFVPKRAEN